MFLLFASRSDVEQIGLELSLLPRRRRRECTGAGGTPLCQLLKFLLYKLQYRIRLHLLSKPRYDSQFRQFALENRILLLDVANAYQVLF